MIEVFIGKRITKKSIIAVAFIALLLNGVTIYLWPISAASEEQNVTTANIILRTSAPASSIHDIAVINVSASKSVLGVGFPFSVGLTAQNQGTFTETFNVTTYANERFLNQTEITLASGTLTTLDFVLNTTVWAYDNYTLRAYAEPVPGETNIVDNNYTSRTPVHVGPAGDVSSPAQGVPEGAVNMRDISYLILFFNTSPSSPNWKPNADINNDNVVNMKDIMVPVVNFMKGNIYHMAFCSWDDTAAPLPPEAERDIRRFVAMGGKGLHAAENAGTICVDEDFWMLQGPNSWKPLMDEGLFKVMIVSIDPYLRDEPTDTYVGNTLASGPSKVELDITAGLYDSWILVIANECKDFSYPLIVKIGVEVNGNQGGGESWVADYGATPSAFIGAWRRIVDDFRTAGVTNVAWCISYTWQSAGLHGVSDYYPGDDYVDWVGIDMYQDNPTASDWPVHQIDEIYNNPTFINKPLGITEWGANWLYQSFPDSVRAAYINDFFDCIELRPRIRFLRYHWNRDFRFQDDDPLDTSTYMPLTTAAYRNRIANRLYVA